MADIPPPPPPNVDLEGRFARWSYQFWDYVAKNRAGNANGIAASSPITIGTGTTTGGAASGTYTIGHATSGVAAGTYGNSTAVGQLIIDARGHISSGVNVGIAFPTDRALEASAPITVTTAAGTYTVSHDTSGVTAGTYGGTNVFVQAVVDARGHLTSLTSAGVGGASDLVMTGDVLGTSVAGTLAAALSTTGVVAGTYGTAANPSGLSAALPAFVVDAKGRILSAGKRDISFSSPLTITGTSSTSVVWSHAASGAAEGTFGGTGASSVTVPRFGLNTFGHVTVATNIGTAQAFSSDLTAIATATGGGVPLRAGTGAWSYVSAATGTFTPSIEGDGTAGTGSYSLRLGNWTTFYDRVFFEINLNYSLHNGAGNMIISGLPFTSEATVGHQFPLSVAASNLVFPAATAQLAARVNAGDTTISMITFGSNGAVAGLAMDTAAQVRLSGHYQR